MLHQRSEGGRGVEEGYFESSLGSEEQRDSSMSVKKLIKSCLSDF